MGRAIGSYRDIVAWQKAVALGKQLYRLSRDFPADERYGLASQLRRSGIAVASNIAEGYGRGSRVDYIRFLKIARGSLYEADTQLTFAHDFGYINDDEFVDTKSQLDEAERILAGLIRSLENTAQSSTS